MKYVTDLRGAELGCLLMLLAALCPAIQAGAAEEQAGTPPTEVVTPWHFEDETLDVDEGIPVGAVIAVASLPESGDMVPLRGRIAGGMWSNRGLRKDYQMARTDLPGVWIRVVPEKRPLVTREFGLFPALWKSGGYRIELVRTGYISSGIVSRVRDPLEYQVWSVSRGYRHLLLRERLRYDGVLRLRVRAGSTGQVQTG